MQPAEHWFKLEKDLVQCTLCPHNCVIDNGKFGICRARQNIDGELKSVTYGKISALAEDPIEKKPLYHFLPNTKTLSLSSVGCNLTCSFCQNHNLSRGNILSVDLHRITPAELVRHALDKEIPSIAFTYNEPIINYEFVTKTAELARSENIETIVVSAGYISPTAYEGFFKNISAANIDLKSFNYDFYKKHCGCQIDPIKNTLIYLANETNVHLEVTNLLIPGINDSKKEITELCHWFRQNLGSGVPLHFSAFHPSYKMTDIPRTPLTTMEMAYDIAKECGLSHIYLGNVRTDKGNITYCTNCGTELIKRDWFAVTEMNLDGNRCNKCQSPSTIIIK